MKKISVVTACYNEEANVEEVYRQVKEVFEGLPGYTYEHIFIDNASEDRTAVLLRKLAAADKNVKVIINSRKLWSYPVSLLRVFTGFRGCVYPVGC